MALQIVIFSFSLLWYFSQLPKMVEGGYNMKLSLKEEEEIEKEHMRLNKPALKTIKTEYGDIYDCVDFYQQPAFDHPLLKHNKYDHHQKSPSFLIRKKANKIGQPSETWPLGEGCPMGTVPIRRTTKEDLIRAKFFKETKNDQTYHAMVRTKNIPNKKYNGGSAEISMFNITVGGSQYSSGLMRLGNDRDSIEIGWTVNPRLYGDSLTRLYIYSTNGSSSCYNTQCPGFVVVSRKVPLGMIFTNVSVRGYRLLLELFSIYREQVSGRWWVQALDTRETIGYWPPEIFNGLKDLASHVEWGGKVNTAPGIAGPKMGSGEPLTGVEGFDAFCTTIKIVNEANEIVDVQDTEIFNENRHYYKAFDFGMYKDPYRRAIGFGGRGPK